MRGGGGLTRPGVAAPPEPAEDSEELDGLGWTVRPPWYAAWPALGSCRDRRADRGDNGGWAGMWSVKGAWCIFRGLLVRYQERAAVGVVCGYERMLKYDEEVPRGWIVDLLRAAVNVIGDEVPAALKGRLGTRRLGVRRAQEPVW